MQFMEPLGATDGSVSAAWDFPNERWREDVIEVTRELAPPLIRWGGCYSSYYRWREGVGPREERQPMLNLLWGGVESNQVGTHEFVDFCHQTGAEPLLAVNFESDGRQHWAHPPACWLHRGQRAGGTDAAGVRSAGPEEAAAWVDYCNNPDNALRKAHGVAEPYNVRLWQIGNETSYSTQGYDLETAAQRTLVFARAMRASALRGLDPKVTLIGWGEGDWARRMVEVAGEELDMLAFHNMFSAGSREEGSPLRGTEYRKDPARTWEHLMDAYREPEAKLLRMREQVAGTGMPLAITECHFTLPGRNRNEVLSSWAAGVANARVMNVYERNGDVLQVATLADFFGTRWMVNAVMIPVPGGQAFMMPVARVMSLYRHHVGQQAVEVVVAPEGLDVTASRTDDTVYLHVANTLRTRAVPAQLGIDGRTIRSGTVFEIAADPELEILPDNGDALAPMSRDLPACGDPHVDAQWTFPPASVSVVELILQAQI
jgi:alpha-L-arabinofuranosidase